MKREDLLARFGLQEKTVFINSIQSEVKIRKLNLIQREEVNDILFSNTKFLTGMKKVQVPMLDLSKAAKVGVSYGLVEPVLTLNDIEKFSEDSNDFIMEVFNAIQEFDEPKK